ncbi:hypothetical protein C8J57DRAFT_1536192 [Mycena rebaudengoi]|nr:hypothetical protein C8J57DRAFT_1536192 [Mycena rebaudengoi]
MTSNNPIDYSRLTGHSADSAFLLGLGPLPAPSGRGLSVSQMQNALNSGMFDPANRFEDDLGDDSEDEEEQMAAAYTYLQQLEYILPPYRRAHAHRGRRTSPCASASRPAPPPPPPPPVTAVVYASLVASVYLSPQTYMDFSSSPTPPTVSAAALDAHVMPPRRIPTRILARYVRACLDVYLRPICYVAFRLRVRGVSRLQTSASDRTGLYCAAALAAHRRGISTRSPALTARTLLSPSAHSVSGHRRSRRRLCTSCRRGAILRIKFSPLSSLNLGTLVSSLQYRYAATLGSSKNSDLWASNRHPTRAWHSAPRWERPARECQIPRYTSPLRGWVNQNVLILAGTGTYNPPEPIISSRSTSYTVTIQSSISSLWPSLSTGA